MTEAAPGTESSNPRNAPTSGSVRLGVLFLLLSATSFGAIAIFARLAYQHGADVHGVLVVRFVIAGAMLAVLMLGTAAGRPAGADLRRLVVMGAVGYVGQSFCYFTALTRVPAGLVAALLYTYPALVAIAAVFLARRAPARSTLIAVGLAITGVALVAGVQLSGDVTGILLGLSAAFIYTGYIMVGSRLSPSVTPLASATVVCLSAAAVYTVACLFHHPALPSDTTGWIGATATALVSTVVAIVAFFFGLRLLGPASAAALSTAEPAVTAVLAFAFLSERLSWLQLLGGAAICVSVLIVATSSEPT